jgi:hypothetical protein
MFLDLIDVTLPRERPDRANGPTAIRTESPSKRPVQESL